MYRIIYALAMVIGVVLLTRLLLTPGVLVVVAVLIILYFDIFRGRRR